MKPVLLVDDETQFLFSAKITLRSSGIDNVATESDPLRVMSRLQELDVSVLLLDLSMPGLSGLALLEQVKPQYPDLPVIVVTAHNELDVAVECMKKGAFDYLVKPVDNRRFVSAVQRALEMNSLRDQVSTLTRRLLTNRLENPGIFSRIITQDPAMLRIFQYIEVIAASDQPILITGETGVGKELVARAVHDTSRRRGHFVAVNVAGLDDVMFSDTLFGHRKGAFTGAARPREGLTAKAADGTLFLDEIGDLSQASQVKLLRLLQERQYYPLGADTPKSSRARVVVATHQDLNQTSFRSDLYYRLSTHHIHIPPLRERPDDIPLLLNHFLRESAASLFKETPTPPKELGTLLKTCPFPGNVRELQSMVHDAVARHQKGVLSMELFREKLGRNSQASISASDTFETEAGRFPSLKEMETRLIREALKRSEGNQGVAAGLLGISRQALNKRLTRDPGLNPCS